MSEQPAMPKLLTPDEAKRLKYCAEVIRRDRAAFMDVGAALLTIRQQRLYRATHSTFEAYCAEVLEMSDRRARQLMEAFEVTMGLQAEVFKTGTIVPLPKTESQAREIAKVEPEKRWEVLQAAAEKCEGEPTAKAIKEAAHESSGETAPIKKFNFIAVMERVAKKIFELADHAEDNTDLESMEEELLAMVDRIRERRATFKKVA